MRNRMQVNVLGALFLMLFLRAPMPESPVADAAMKGDIETVQIGRAHVRTPRRNLVCRLLLEKKNLPQSTHLSPLLNYYHKC